MAAASAWSSTRESSLVLGMPMHVGFPSPGALALHCRSDSICLVGVLPVKVVVGVCVQMRIVTPRQEFRGKVLHLTTACVLQQVAPARLVRVRKGSGPLESNGVWIRRLGRESLHWKCKGV
jgi:hypothetical protein